MSHQRLPGRIVPLRERRRVSGLTLMGLMVAGIMIGTVVARVGASAPPVSTMALGEPLGSYSIVVDTHTHRAFIATVKTSQTAVPVSSINVLDIRTGTLLPPVVVGVNLLPPALDRLRDHIVVTVSTPGGGTMVRLLDGHNGSVLGSAPLNLDPLSMAVDGRAGRIFVAGSMHVCAGTQCDSPLTFIALLDARTLHLRDTVTVGPSSGTITVDESRGRVVIPTNDGLVVLNASSGQVQSIIPGRSVLAFDNKSGDALINDATGVAMVDLARGHVRWRRSEMVMSAALDQRTGNVLIIPVASNALEVVQGRTGRTLHSITVGRLPVSVAIGARSGRVFVANHDDHTVSVIDARSWRVLRTLAVGPYPITVMVDDAAGRAIVANTSMYARTQGAAWPWLPPPLRRMLAGSSFLSTRTIPSVPTSGSVSLLDLGQM